MVNLDGVRIPAEHRIGAEGSLVAGDRFGRDLLEADTLQVVVVRAE